MTTTGLDWSLGKCASRMSCALTESTWVRNVSVCGTGSSLRVGTNAAQATSARNVTTQTVRARRPTRRATPPHRPVASLCSEPYIGRNGQ